MKLPLFNAEASLYTTRGSYRSGGEVYGIAQNTVLAQLSSCNVGCLGNYALCIGESGGDVIPLIACYVSMLVCQANCPDDSPGGPPVGPAPCCPSGKTCKCGGTCVSGKGCVDGTCLGPNQKCP